MPGPWWERGAGTWHGDNRSWDLFELDLGWVTSNLPAWASASAKLCWGTRRMKGSCKKHWLDAKTEFRHHGAEENFGRSTFCLWITPGAEHPHTQRHPWTQQPPLPWAGCSPGHPRSCPRHPLQWSEDDGQPPNHLSPITCRHTRLGRRSNCPFTFYPYYL